MFDLLISALKKFLKTIQKGGQELQKYIKKVFDAIKKWLKNSLGIDESVLVFESATGVEKAEFIPMKSFFGFEHLNIRDNTWRRLLNQAKVSASKTTDGLYVLVYKEKQVFRGTKKKTKAFIAELVSKNDKPWKLKGYLDDLVEELEKIIKLGIKTDGQNWFWKNASGTELRWAKLSKKAILNKIKTLLSKVGDDGAIFEGEVAQEMLKLAEKYGDEVTDVSNDVMNITSTKIRNGDIDCATKKYIIEAKSSLTHNESINKLVAQLEKYLPENAKSSKKYLNPFNKKVVVVYDDLGTFTLNDARLKTLSDEGVIFIDGIKNLKNLYLK